MKKSFYRFLPQILPKKISLTQIQYTKKKESSSGNRTYKVRTRNANGFSDWGDPMEFEVPEVPE